jgi:hypothetical protein
MQQQPWVQKEKKAENVLDVAAHKGDLVHDGPYVSIRHLHFENVPPPEGQGRFFMVTFKHPIRIQKVRDRIMESFGEKEDPKNGTP